MDITLTHDGKSFVVADDRAWSLIEAVENVITLTELHPLIQSGRIPYARVFRAYAAALAVAGAGRVSAEALRKATNMQDAGRMAVELCGILFLAMPDIDFEPSGDAGDADIDDAKKKA